MARYEVRAFEAEENESYTYDETDDLEEAKRRVDKIVTRSAGWIPEGWVWDTVTNKAVYSKSYKTNPMPIENRGPAPGAKWLAGAITRPGKLGGPGFLSKPLKTQKQILDRCERQYGYRSCLGSVMILQRIPATAARFGPRLAQLKSYLVKKYGGPGSFLRPPRGLSRARRKLANPHEPGHFVLIPELTGEEAIMVKTNPKEEELMFSEATPQQMRAGFEEMKRSGGRGEIRGRYAGVAKDLKRRKKIEDAKRGISAVMRRALRGT
jgi:hypothetical protein